MALTDPNKLKLVQHVLECNKCTVNLDVFIATNCDMGIILGSHLSEHFLHVMEDSHTHVESA